MTDRFRGGLWAAALLLLAGCSGKTEQPPLWIGHIATLTGPDKAAGDNARRGIRLAVEEANQNPEEKGAGRPVRVLHVNSRGDPETFGAEATRLIRVNRVVGLLGGRHEEDIKEFRRLEGAGVCLISPTGPVGDASTGGNVFFTGPAPTQQGKALGRFAAKKGFQHILVLVDGEEGAGRFRARADAFKDTFLELLRKQGPRKKGNVQGPWNYGSEVSLEKRVGRIAREIKKAGTSKKGYVDAIFIAGKPEAVLRLRGEAALSRIPILYGGDDGDVRNLSEEPETNDHLYLATAFVPDAGIDQARAFVKKFKERFGEEPDVNAALAYDDARLLFTALRNAKTLEANAIRESLAGIKDFPGLTGPLSFAANGQVERAVFIVRLDQGAPIQVKRYP